MKRVQTYSYEVQRKEGKSCSRIFFRFHLSGPVFLLSRRRGISDFTPPHAGFLSPIRDRVKVVFFFFFLSSRKPPPRKTRREIFQLEIAFISISFRRGISAVFVDYCIFCDRKNRKKKSETNCSLYYRSKEIDRGMLDASIFITS